MCWKYEQFSAWCTYGVSQKTCLCPIKKVLESCLPCCGLSIYKVFFREVELFMGPRHVFLGHSKQRMCFKKNKCK